MKENYDLPGPDFLDEPDLGTRPDVYAQGAAFYVVLLKAGYYDEAADFAAWFIETFDIDLES